MAEDSPSHESLERLIERLDRLESLLRADSARLSAVERHLGIGARRADADAAGALPPPARERGAADAGETVEHFAADASAPAGGSENARERAGATRRDFESIIGGSWFNWIGIIAVAVGIGLFLKLAVENEWVGPGVRVMMGAASGLGLLALGERLRGRGFRQYAYVLSGGGILVLYLSIYAAYNFYGLVNRPTAFTLMVAATAAAVLLSVRLNALPIAIFGLIGGFVTPLLLSTGQDNQVGLFAYVALLDAGVLAVAYFKRWGSLNFLSFAATALMIFGWLVVHYHDEKLWTTLFFLTLFFILYSLLAVVHNLLPRRRADWLDVMLVAANASLYFGLCYMLLVDAGYERRLPASMAVVVSTLFVLLFYAAWRLSRADRLLSYVYIGAAVTFFTVAVGIQYELYWVTIAWAVEGLMLTWVGLRAEEPAAWRAALAVFALAALHWLVWDLPEGMPVSADFVPLLNRRALSCAALVAALAVAARLHSKREGASDGARLAVAGLVVAANLITVVALSAEASGYFDARMAAVSARMPPPPVLGESFAEYSDARVEYERISRPVRELELSKQLVLSLVWALYGAGLLVAGRVRRVRLLRLSALVLLGLTTLKVFFWDLSSLDSAYRIVSFIALGLVLLAVSYLYQKSRQHAEAAAEGST